MKICELCGKEHDGTYGSGRFCSKHCRMVFIGKQTKRHVCNFNKNNKSHEHRACRAPYGTWTCPHCGQIFEIRSKLHSHQHSEHSEYYGKTAWNKGLTKETDKRLEKSAKTLSRRYKSGEIVNPQKGKSHTLEEKIKMMNSYSLTVQKYRGIYNNVRFECSFELAFLIYHNEVLHKPVYRCKRVFGYVDHKNKYRHYFPDFEYEDGTIIEIKGYIFNKIDNNRKIRSVLKTNTKYIFLNENSELLKTCLEYANNKYGKDFIKKFI